MERVGGIGDFEKNNILDNKEEFSNLKKNIEGNPIPNKKKFISFLNTFNLRQVDRSTELGKYLRAMRYEDTIMKHASKHKIDFDTAFALIMTESYGDPLSFNPNDGGAGISHFQADVARRLGELSGIKMKVFTDHPKYRHLNIKDALEKYYNTKEYKLDLEKSKSHKEADVRTKYRNKIRKKVSFIKHSLYKKQGAELEKIMNEIGFNYEKAAALDDRFNVRKSIGLNIGYLNYIYDNFVNTPKGTKKIKSKTSDKSRSKYKDGYDFKTLLAANGYNKGPSRYLINFGTGTHMKHVIANIDAKREYDGQLTNLMNKGLTGEEIMNQLISKKELVQAKSRKIAAPKKQDSISNNVKKNLNKRDEREIKESQSQRDQTQEINMYGEQVKTRSGMYEVVAYEIASREDLLALPQDSYCIIDGAIVRDTIVYLENKLDAGTSLGAIDFIRTRMNDVEMKGLASLNSFSHKSFLKTYTSSYVDVEFLSSTDSKLKVAESGVHQLLHSDGYAYSPGYAIKSVDDFWDHKKIFAKELGVEESNLIWVDEFGAEMNEIDDAINFKTRLIEDGVYYFARK